MLQITHYIDRQFGCPIHLGTESNIIKFVAPSDLTKKFNAALEGKSVEEGQAFLDKLYKGIYFRIKKFDSPFLNKISDYK